MNRQLKIVTVMLVFGLVLWTTSAHGFVAAWIQRALIIAQQVTQIGNQVEQIKQFQAKLDKIREQVDMVKNLKDSALDGLNALKDPFASLVSAPTQLVSDTMNWGGEFTGEARRTFDAARDFGRNARSLREGWHGRLAEADQVTESDILAAYPHLSPEDRQTVIDAWKRRREKADSQLIHDHTVADAAAALTAMLKETQTSIEKLRNQTNKSATALGQAQVTGQATQAEILTAIAQLQAWQAARDSAKGYQEEIERRQWEAEEVVRQRHEARRADELGQHWGRVGRSMRESIRRQAQDGPSWLR